ncbi:unnamed protein product, partial [Ectocarpus sp. 6 AP-2014]
RPSTHPALVIWRPPLCLTRRCFSFTYSCLNHKPHGTILRAEANIITPERKEEQRRGLGGSARRLTTATTAVRPLDRIQNTNNAQTGTNDHNLLLFLLHHPLPSHRHFSWRVVFASTPSLQAADKKKRSPGCALHIENTLSSLRHPRQWLFSIPKCSFFIY